MRVDVVARPVEGLPAGQVRPECLQLLEPLPEGMVLGSVEAPTEEREQPRQIGAVPVAVDVGLAEPDPGPAAELLPHHVGPHEVDHDLGALPVPEPATAPVGIAQHDAASCHRLEGAEDEPPRGGAEDRHRRVVPFPGTNGGFEKKGTRFAHSRAACRWMRATTVAGITG